MKIQKLISVLLLLTLFSGCGGIQKARYYQSTNAKHEPHTKSWGDGVATADRDICMWVGDGTALYLPMMAGPIGLPFFPLGVVEGEIDRSEYFDLLIWIIPKNAEQRLIYQFDPTATYIEFENGDIIQPQTVQVSRFKTYWDGKNELISHPEHSHPKPNKDFQEPIKLFDWSRFTIRFEKPNKDIGPLRVKIEGLTSKDGKKKHYEFSFKEVTKYRYLISGHNPNGEWGLASEASPCREMFKQLNE